MHVATAGDIVSCGVTMPSPIRGAVVVALVALLQPAAHRPVFAPLQPNLFGAGGALVNAAADYDGDGDIGEVPVVVAIEG
ncbi:MAG: hypothetical protein ACRD1V_10520, partial [Vicinamibacterales bacterium]